MAQETGPSTLTSVQTEDDDELPDLEPLTRRGYKRLPDVEKQIRAALTLDQTELIVQAQEVNEDSAGYLSCEALVYFIRRAVVCNDRGAWDGLFRVLYERCMPYFRGKFNGFPEAVREELQQEVMCKIVNDVSAQDSRGDFMQVRFWKYLEARCTDVRRIAGRREIEAESLDAEILSDGESSSGTLLERLKHKGLSPDLMLLAEEGLEKLPHHLRELYILRHWFGWREKELAERYERTDRTIRNWLEQARELLAGS